MTIDPGLPPLHFLLLGHAKEHVRAIIEHYSIRNAVILTSTELEEENLPFIQSLRDEGVAIVEVINLEPFGQGALERMTARILDTYHACSGTGRTEFVVALTGGTNLMVVAMALVALMKGRPAHYVLNNGRNEVVEIDLFERLAPCVDAAEMETLIRARGGER
jgi:CRISPR/Cas system-associated protein Csm6